MTIRRKVQIGFAVILLMFAGLSGFAINQIAVMTRHFKGLTEHAIPTLGLTAQMSLVLDKLRLTGARVVPQEALRALAAETAAGRRYDLVLVDPPYEMYSSLQAGLSRYLPAVIADDGLVVVETAAREEPELPPLHKRTSRRYGRARITLFENP